MSNSVKPLAEVKNILHQVGETSVLHGGYKGYLISYPQYSRLLELLSSLDDSVGEVERVRTPDAFEKTLRSRLAAIDSDLANLRIAGFGKTPEEKIKDNLLEGRLLSERAKIIKELKNYG